MDKNLRLFLPKYVSRGLNGLDYVGMCEMAEFYVRNVGNENYKYSRIPLYLDWMGQRTIRYAEYPDNWIFFWKQATLAVWSSDVTVCSIYPRLNLSTTPNLEF